MQDEIIDEQHDLLYLVKETTDGYEKIPQSYKELKSNLIIKLRCIASNLAEGEILFHQIPQGRYKIYYLRPVERARVIRSACMRL